MNNGNKSNDEWLSIYKALKKDQSGFYYYTTPTSVRRNGKMKVSKKRHQWLIDKFGNIKL